MASDPNAQADRRKAILSDSDIERIGDAFDHKMRGLFEVIGYDTSTPESRSEIRKDHEFVRSARNAKGTAVTAFLGSIAAAIGVWLYAAIGKH